MWVRWAHVATLTTALRPPWGYCLPSVQAGPRPSCRSCPREQSSPPSWDTPRPYPWSEAAGAHVSLRMMTKPRYSGNTVLGAPLPLTQPNTPGVTNSHPGRCLFTLSLSFALTLQVMSSSLDLTPHLTEASFPPARSCLTESPQGWREALGTVTVTTNGEVLDKRQHCPSGTARGEG